MTTVLIADDENLLRRAIASLLDLEDDITVVAQAENGADAVRLTALHTPDVVLLDLEMPGADGRGIDGIETATAILAARPDQAVILLTRHARPGVLRRALRAGVRGFVANAHARPGVLRRALRAGVRGFVAKSVDPERLAQVIADVHAGRRHIDSEISTAAMIDDCPLTDRELELLRLTADGRSVREMSATLHLAAGTVRNYLSSAMQKTGTAARHEAARVARERGWL